MGKGLPYKLFREFHIPLGANEEFFSDASEYSPRDGQIFIVSYPKCGTTWMQHIVYLLLRNGKAANSISEVISSIPFPEQDGFPSDVPQKDIYALKYHLPFRLMKYSEDARYIHVARNPKDACVSYYNFLKKLPGYHIESFDDFFDAFISGEMPYGDYVDLVYSWYEKRHLKNVLFITYESLTENRRASILEIASFLGLQTINEEIIENVLQYSSFNFMKSLVEEDPFMQQYLNNSTGQRKNETKNEKPQMMRKGIVGDWRNYFNRQQNQRMKEYFESKTEGMALLPLWKDEILNYE
ncbi:sulfotransferase 1B1 [Parasteatoda tepidariorum]|uniref:sulfotransferase 1B1 n=1 Tax=Parasteatoda tepidariorum TaxID=114398 RepID=UPI001C720BAB|nr:sulfotransferase family cytosolic 1B member 1 [Parasteatoda tepidariorum]XP_042903084.1 sulfotransferase family cytosolic 1B member 1 [Parasteatoda tepidariorum]